MEIAFIQGIIPAVTQDQAGKPKAKKEDKKKDWDAIDDEDENKSHSSVYEF